MTKQNIQLGLGNPAPAASTCGCGGGECMCGHGSAHAASTSSVGAAEGAVTTSLLVEGMTCEHCVASVTEELSGLIGVEAVSVDLQPGGASRVTVASDSPLRDEDVRAAVEEAGYTLVGRP